MSVSVVVKNGAYMTGEGPHWEPTSSCLLYVDILAGDVHRWDSTTNTDSKVHLDDPVSFVVPRRSGGYLIGLGRTVSYLDWNSGNTTVLHEVEMDTKNRFNDGKCDPIGRLWAGTMGPETVPAHPELEMGTLYSMETDGMLRSHSVVPKVSISNGLAWSSDNTTMYYIDSVPRKVYAFDYDMDKGSLSNQRTCIDFGDDTLPERGYPDGMCIDTDDNLWIACYNASKVIKFNPRTGEELEVVSFPTSRITSCCWGGPNCDELYVTCGKYGMSDSEFKKEPLAGSIFKVTGLGVKGTSAHIYDG